MRKVSSRCLAAGLVCCLSLSSCGFLPKEEEYRTAPTVKEYEGEEYTYVSVTREEVRLTKKISCVYSSAEEYPLSFGAGGFTVRTMACAAGDTVKAGEVLAELDLGTLEADYSDQSYELEKLRLQLDQWEELLELEERRRKAAGESDSLMASGYERQIAQGSRDLELAEDKLAAIGERIRERRLVAPADGSISYVKADMAGKASVKDEVVIRVVGGEECYFVAEKEETGELAEGAAVSITVGSTVYDAVVSFPENPEQVCFVLEAGGGRPEVGSRGSATLVLEKRDNVLALSNQAIRKVGGRYVVYYEDENGIKNMKEIEVGLVGNSMSEIRSGLEFGERVIVK